MSADGVGALGAAGDLAAIVGAYNEACSHDDVAAIVAFFTADAVIYDLNHPPVVGREAIGAFWASVRARWQGATWATDAVVTDGEAAVTEWTMHGRSRAGEPFAFHGADVFAFDHSAAPPLIREIRQYWRFDRHHLDAGLVGYPYPQRTAAGGAAT